MGKSVETYAMRWVLLVSYSQPTAFYLIQPNMSPAAIPKKIKQFSVIIS